MGDSLSYLDNLLILYIHQAKYVFLIKILYHNINRVSGSCVYSSLRVNATFPITFILLIGLV